MSGKRGHWPDWLSGVVVFLSVLLVLALGPALYHVLQIGSGYYAKTLCSGVFVSKLDEARVRQEDVLADQTPLLSLFSSSVDRHGQTVWTSFLGLAQRRAVFRDGLGCTLDIGKSATELQTETEKFSREIVYPEVGQPWPVGKLASQLEPDSAVDQAKLNRVLDEAFIEPDGHLLRRTRAIVVIHEGQLVAERYADGIGPDTPLIGWSLTKTFINALFGVAKKDGKMSVDRDRLLAWWGLDGDRRAGVTVDDLLRMNSGIVFDEDYNGFRSDVRTMLFRKGDMSLFAASKPLSGEPGRIFSYSSGTTNILTRALREAYNLSYEDYLALPRRALFNRLRMASAVLEPDAAGNLVGSSSMYASARDWGRLGLFFLNDGVFDGLRILPEGWVSYSLVPSKTSKKYGAHIWLKLPNSHLSPTPVDPPVPDDAFFMLGHDGQLVAVIPSMNLVVVRLGLSRAEGSWRHEPFLSDIVAVFQ